MTSLRVVGQPVGRIEGRDKVTGAGKYAGDMALPGMLWAKLLRSPVPHAKIVGIDTSKATQVPGVRAIMTGKDVPSRLNGRMVRDMPLLAQDEVRFIGDKVAVVAADSAEAAARAVELIDVEYDELPAVFSPFEALQLDAPAVHPDHELYERGAMSLWSNDFPKPDPCPSNLYAMLTDVKGDVDAGFKSSDRVFEQTFNLPRTHQAYMEAHACLVTIDDGGRVQIWAHNKQPHGLKNAIADIAGVEPSQVRVNVTYIGGDFGGKSSPMDVPLMYFVAKATQRPIKMVMSYVEEFMAANPRHPGYVVIKTGVMNDGAIVAREARTVLNCGAYAAFKPQGAIVGAKAGGCYNIPNTRIQIQMVYTNTVPGGHSRAPGSPQATFAVESHTDHIAKELGIDPLELRLKNVLHDGDTNPSGRAWQEIKAEETLRAAAEAIGWGGTKPPNVGRGLALFDHNTGQGNSSATVTVERDGTVTVLSATFDQGAGIHTIQKQIVAEELSVEPSTVTVTTVDTDQSVTDSGVGNSRTTFLAGQAAKLAAEVTREKLINLAAQQLECDASELSVANGHVVRQGAASLPIGNVVSRQAGDEGLAGYAEFKSGATDVTSFTTQAAEVEVDPETGQSRILRFITVVDSGTIINPLSYRGQINGGFVTGLGYALMEEMPDSNGAIQTLSFADYKLPTIADLPELEVVSLPEVPSGPGPYRGKSVGETHNPPVAAAIANAVADAVGVRLMSLPATAEKVKAGLAP
jgi:CO/xanthine dehydrogenase Mo-binding subunit